MSPVTCWPHSIGPMLLPARWMLKLGDTGVGGVAVRTCVARVAVPAVASVGAAVASEHLQGSATHDGPQLQVMPSVLQ